MSYLFPRCLAYSLIFVAPNRCTIYSIILNYCSGLYTIELYIIHELSQLIQLYDLTDAICSITVNLQMKKGVREKEKKEKGRRKRKGVWESSPQDLEAIP